MNEKLTDNQKQWKSNADKTPTGAIKVHKAKMIKNDALFKI